MKNFTVIVSSVLLGVFASSCAMTHVVDRDKEVTEKLPKPAIIYVHDFIANPADIPKDSSPVLSELADDTPIISPENLKLGKKIGSQIATQIVANINKMGLSGKKGSSASKPKPNDIVLRGYLISVKEGDAVNRMVVGFGVGASKIVTVVVGFQMTENGLRRLGTAKLESMGSQTPGGGLGALSLITQATPVGLIAGAAVKGYDELSGSATIEGRVKGTVSEISEQLKIRFKEQNWIK